ncbi:MAG: cytochrome c-type biogenesis protein CcmH [Acidobacteriia bacterium]|nr:cytochrome c-type biogenesis protein CcmH [Terriglobia bacterium]
MKASTEYRVPSTERRIRKFAALAILCFVVVLFMGAGDDLSGRFDKLGHKLMCRCGCNQVLLECNHVGCTYSDGMRNELMAGLQRGDSDDLVLQAFVQKYGPTVMAAPTTTGFNRVAWIMPFVALTGGLLLVVVIVKAWNTRRAVAVVPAGGATVDAHELDELRRRVHQETEL